MIYGYSCKNCGVELEVEQSMKEDALTKCPTCGAPELGRLVTGGAGTLFLGYGWTPRGDRQFERVPRRD